MRTRIDKKMVVCAIGLIAIFFILIYTPKAHAQVSKQYLRYTIQVRIAKPLPTFITNNLAAIQTSLNKIKTVSQKIHQGYDFGENTDGLTIDNNAVFLGVTASFAVPYPLPQNYLDEQAAFENFITKLSQFALPDDPDNNYFKQVSKHVCGNGQWPFQPCGATTNF